MTDPVQAWLDDIDPALLRDHWSYKEVARHALALGITDPKHILAAVTYVEEAARIAAAYNTPLERIIASLDTVLDTIEPPKPAWYLRWWAAIKEALRFPLTPYSIMHKEVDHDTTRDR